MSVSPALIAVHVLLLVGAAFMVGGRVYRETHPKGAVEADHQQLNRLSIVVSIAMFLMLVALVIGLDLGLFTVAGKIQ